MLERKPSLTHDKTYNLFYLLLNVYLVESIAVLAFSLPRGDNDRVGTAAQLPHTFLKNSLVLRKVLLLDDKPGGLGCKLFPLVEP